MQVSVLTIDTTDSGCYTLTMPRELRIEYPGAIYHVLNRGDQRDDIFLDDEDRREFLATLEECRGKTGWEAHAYCLMRNHFHLVIETPRANLVAGMHWLSGVYTKRGDSEAGREMFALLMERRRAEEATADYGRIRRGWFVGSERFKQELLAAASERVGLSNYGAERQESDMQRAERIVREEMGRLGWVEQDLRSHRKGDERKVGIAGRLRQETTVSLKWIAQRLQMGSWTYVSNLLHGTPAVKPPAQQQLPLCQ